MNIQHSHVSKLVGDGEGARKAGVFGYGAAPGGLAHRP